jgi:SAM-dependent methyltransferase
MTTDWDQCYREGTTPWNKGEPSPPLKAWLGRNQLTGRVIVPGCGLGHDVALLAESGADVVGLDVSVTAIEGAKVHHPSIQDRLVAGDLFAPPLEMIGSFDALVEHTCLSGMPPEWRTRYAEACRRLLKPDGMIIGVWFIEPEMDPGESGPPFALPVAALDAMFDKDFKVVEDYVPEESYDGRAGRERLRVLKRLG